MRAPKRCAKRVDVNGDDGLDVLEVERLERNDVVDAVEQLGTQRDRNVALLEIGRQDDQRVAEIDGAPLGVGDAAVVENLQQNGGHVGMRFFEFVKEHDAIRAAANRFGELARLVVTGISGRRAE